MANEPNSPDCRPEVREPKPDFRKPSGLFCEKKQREQKKWVFREWGTGGERREEEMFQCASKTAISDFSIPTLHLYISFCDISPSNPFLSQSIPVHHLGCKLVLLARRMI